MNNVIIKVRIDTMMSVSSAVLNRPHLGEPRLSRAELVHLVVELGHPFADVALEGVDFQISILDEDDLADHRVLPPELVVIYRVQKQRRLVLPILGVDDESLWFGSSIPLFKKPLGIVVEMTIDACLDGVSYDRQGVALLLRSIIVEFGHDVLLVALQRRGRVLGFVVLLVLVTHQLTFFLHDIAEEVLDHRSLPLFGLLLLGLICGHQQIIVRVQLL